MAIEQRGLDRLPPDEAEHVRRFGWRLLLGWFAESVTGRPRPRREEPPMTDTTTSTTGAAPVAVQGVTPYLYYADAGAGLDWLARVFGFEETVRYVDDDGVVHESEMRIGASTIQLCGRAPDPDQGSGLLLIVHVDDVDAMHARVVAAGVDAPPPEQKPYGPRTFTVTDPWGYHWDFWQPVHAYEQGEGGLPRGPQRLSRRLRGGPRRRRSPARGQRSPAPGWRRRRTQDPRAGRATRRGPRRRSRGAAGRASPSPTRRPPPWR